MKSLIQQNGVSAIEELDESIWRLLHICCIDTEFV